MPGKVDPGPGTRMLMRMSRAHGGGIPKLPHTAQARRGGASAGTNPLQGGTSEPLEYDAQGNPILPPEPTPGTLGGLILQGLTSGRRDEYKAELRAAHEGHMAAFDRASGVYDQALKETGSPQQALLAAVTANNHEVFKDRDLLSRLGEYHQTQMMGQGYSVESLGHGLNVVHGPGGDQISREPPSKQQLITTPGGDVYTANPETGEIGPTHMAGQQPGGTGAAGAAGTSGTVNLGGGGAPQGRAPNDKETDHIVGLDNAFQDLAGLRANVGASGSLLYGHINENIANTPWGGQQAQAYRQYYDNVVRDQLQMQPGNRLKAVFTAMLESLPKPENAEFLNVSQAIPRMELRLRSEVAHLQAQGIQDPTLNQLADTYNAGFKQWNQIDAAMGHLRADPKSTTPEELGKVLMPEVLAGRLPIDMAQKVIQQSIYAGVIDTDTAREWKDKYPSFHLEQPVPLNEQRPAQVPGQPVNPMGANFRTRQASPVTPVPQPQNKPPAPQTSAQPAGGPSGQPGPAAQQMGGTQPQQTPGGVPLPWQQQAGPNTAPTQQPPSAQPPAQPAQPQVQHHLPHQTPAGAAASQQMFEGVKGAAQGALGNAPDRPGVNPAMPAPFAPQPRPAPAPDQQSSAPLPGRQTSFLDYLNPISSAAAAEMPQEQQPQPAQPLQEAADNHPGFDAADFQRLRDAGVSEDILKGLPVSGETQTPEQAQSAADNQALITNARRSAEEESQ